MTSFLPSATIQRLADKNQSIKQMLKPLTVNNLQHYEYIYSLRKFMFKFPRSSNNGLQYYRFNMR